MVNFDRTFRLHIESSSVYVRTKLQIKTEIKTSHLFTKVIRM